MGRHGCIVEWSRGDAPFVEGANSLRSEVRVEGGWRMAAPQGR